MNKSKLFGYYLFYRPQAPSVALKDMLQFMRTHAREKGVHFTLIDSETSLLPHIGPWENLHIATGHQSWNDLLMYLDPQWHPLIHLISDPHRPAKDSSAWERLITSFIKAALVNAQNVMIDIDENLHSPFNLLQFKKMVILLAQKKNVYITSSNPSLWLDHAHGLISRHEYEFIIEDLGEDRLKRHQSA